MAPSALIADIKGAARTFEKQTCSVKARSRYHGSRIVCEVVDAESFITDKAYDVNPLIEKIEER